MADRLGQEPQTDVVDLAGVRRLLSGGAQLVEVLPNEDYHALHLPGAISIPLKQLDGESARRLEPGRDVIATALTGCEI